MSSYSQQYADRVQAVLELKQRQEARKREIQAEVGKTTPNMGASLEHVLNGRYASDGALKDLQAQVDRAVQEAIMYGMGVLMTNTAYLAGRARGQTSGN